MYQVYSETNNNTQMDFIPSNQANRTQWNSFSEYLKPEDKENSKTVKPIGQMFPQSDEMQFDL